MTPNVPTLLNSWLTVAAEALHIREKDKIRVALQDPGQSLVGRKECYKKLLSKIESMA